MHKTGETVLVLGARGRLGSALVKAFAEAGWRVLAQVRPGAPTPSWPGVQWLPHPLEALPALAALAGGAEVVVHALNPPYSPAAWRRDAQAMLAAALNLSRQWGATLMLPGNVYNYGEQMPPLLREDTPQQARFELGRVRIAMEAQMAEAVAAGGLRALVLRAGNFFGQGRGTLLDALVAPRLPQGRSTWIGPQDVATPWAYLPDLAQAFVQVAARRDRLAPFDRLNFAGHQATARQWQEVLTDVAWEQGWLPSGGKLKLRQIPDWVFPLVGTVVPTFAALAQTSYLFRTPHRLDNGRLLAFLGREPHTAFELAVRQALADMGLPRFSAADPAGA